MSGVLPLALEDATKIIGAFLLSGKEYSCLMQLHADVPESNVKQILSDFVGQIYQKPPLRASVKREVRKRRIYWIRDLEIQGRQVVFRIACQAGTYIRKVCSDVGEILGCGAHMRELRRTRSGPFTESDEHFGLYHVLNASLGFFEHGDEEPLRGLVRPMEDALLHIPRMVIRDSAVNALCHGADLAVPGILKVTKGIAPKTPVGVFTLKGELVSLSTSLMSTDQILTVEKGIAAKTNRVVMHADTYPKMWKSKEEKPVS